MTDTNCQHMTNGCCQMASALSGLERVPTSPAACTACAGCKRPQSDNEVTASLALAATRSREPQEYARRAEQLRPYLKRAIGLGAVTRYEQALQRWVLAGRPVRTSDEVQAIFAEHCSPPGVPCPYYRPGTTPQAGWCQRCGCNVRSAGGAIVNKIKMATEHCPINKW